MMTYPIDLHLHSFYSDGSESPQRLIDLAKEKGLKAISITDHDYYTCSKDLIAYAQKQGIELLPGLELSCQDETTHRKVHLLAYQLPPHHPHTQMLMENYKKHAYEQRVKMIQALNKEGLHIQLEDVLPYVHGMLYKQHIALALEKLGYGSYQTLYFRHFKGDGILEQAFPTAFIPIKAAIWAVLEDGGIPVLAHPRSYHTFDEIPKYISWGLKGIEISHPSFRPGDLEKIITYPLLHTGGSDFHGQYNLSDKRQIGHYGIDEITYKQLKGGQNQ